MVEPAKENEKSRLITIERYVYFVRRERADVMEATEVCEGIAKGRAILEKHRERDRETEG